MLPRCSCWDPAPSINRPPVILHSRLNRRFKYIFVSTCQSKLVLDAKMRLHYYFPRTASWLFFCWTYVSAVHLMAQYPPLEEQVGLVDRQQVKCPESTATFCPTGNVCCPSGAACYTSNGVPLCNETCVAAAATCTVNNLLACCQVGQECSPSGCISGSNSGASSSGPETTPTPPPGPTFSFGCGTNVPCYQGTSTWCCLPSLACDFSSPGFCLRSITSSQPPTVTTASSVYPSTTVVTTPISHTAATGLAATGLAAPNVLDEGILVKIWTCFAAMGIALGL